MTSTHGIERRAGTGVERVDIATVRLRLPFACRSEHEAGRLTHFVDLSTGQAQTLRAQLEGALSPGPMTAARRAVLDAMRAIEDEHGRPATVTELGRALGRSKVTIFEHLTAMVRSGHVAAGAPNTAGRYRVRRNENP